MMLIIGISLVRKRRDPWATARQQRSRSLSVRRDKIRRTFGMARRRIVGIGKGWAAKIGIRYDFVEKLAFWAAISLRSAEPGRDRTENRR
jgi:hypothetical protein